jgi:AcrR family transcriptional regulator
MVRRALPPRLDVMVGRPRTVDDTDVFAAVAAVVSRDGPPGMTLGAIAEEVGVTGPALTQRFGSKRGLLVAFAEHESTDVGPVFARARRRDRSSVDVAIAALVSLSGSIRTRRELANHLALLHLDLTDDELGRIAAEQSRAIRAELVSVMSEAAMAGEVDETGVSADELADLLYTTYNGAMITWAIDGTGSLERWTDRRLRAVVAPHRHS